MKFSEFEDAFWGDPSWSEKRWIADNIRELDLEFERLHASDNSWTTIFPPEHVGDGAFKVAGNSSGDALVIENKALPGKDHSLRTSIRKGGVK